MTARMPKSLTPSLRFPDFESSPGWPRVALGAVLREHGLKSDGLSEVHSVSLSKGVVPQVEHMGRSFAADDTSHYSLVRPSDVVYTRSPLAIFKLGIVKQCLARVCPVDLVQTHEMLELLVRRRRVVVQCTRQAELHEALCEWDQRFPRQKQ